ncbi:MAG TPA: 3-oxoacyl-ACP reductase [Actinobacteria bacterium]|nr:3-oxoacyl-ACP reductase [Actinomycetota bacterium]
MELKEKIALITGASQGIGRSISITLAEEGATVILAARNEKKLKEVSTEINNNGGKSLIFPADLSCEKDIKSLFEYIKKKEGRLDILVNNAAKVIAGKFIDFSTADYDSLMAINLRGLFICCREAVSLMLPQKSGYIINISSVVGFKGYPELTAYTASKHGVMGITKSIAAEYQKDGICVSAILPGGVDTELCADARPDLDRSVLMPPQDIADTIRFIFKLSDNAWIDEIYIRRRNSKPF